MRIIIMENKSKKWIKWAGMIITVLAVAGGVFYVYGKWKEPAFDPENFNELIKNAKSPEQIVEYTHLMQEAYKNDPYGGATPEETLNLFVEALKKGDTDMAANYFLIDRRKQMREELVRGIESGGIKYFLDHFEIRGNGHISEDKNGFTLRIRIEKEDGEIVMNLGKNPSNNKWLIEDF